MIKIQNIMIIISNDSESENQIQSISETKITFIHLHLLHMLTP